MNIFNWFKKNEEVKQQDLEMPAVSVAQNEQPKKKRKPKIKKEKVVPPPKTEPRVDVLKFDFDPKDPKLGSIELDWNNEFVELLISHGYRGNTEEDIVDSWLNDVCRTIVTNQYPGTNANVGMSNANIISKKDLGSGKTEVS